MANATDFVEGRWAGPRKSFCVCVCVCVLADFFGDRLGRLPSLPSSDMLTDYLQTSFLPLLRTGSAPVIKAPGL